MGRDLSAAGSSTRKAHSALNRTRRVPSKGATPLVVCYALATDAIGAPARHGVAFNAAGI